MPWLLRHRPEARVVNVVRHPAAFLHSHIGRWLAKADPEENARLNRARLHNIAGVDPHWSAHFGEIDDMSAVESELWYWRYVYETIHAAGRDNPRYLLVRDEDIVADPLGTAKRLYQFTGLDWCAAAQTYLERMAAHWQGHTAPWRQLIEHEHIELVERILAGSEIQTWWEPQQVVSKFDYVAY